MTRDKDKNEYGLFGIVWEYVLSPRVSKKWERHKGQVLSSKIWSRVQSNIWFWIHKILIIAYTLSVYAGLPDRDNIFYTEDKEWCFEYFTSSVNLPEELDILRSIIFFSMLRVMLFVLICFTWVMSIRAFKKQVTDYDYKKNYFADGRNLFDILLNIIAVVALLRVNGAVNYTYLSTNSSDCGFWSKVSLYQKLKSDLDDGQVYTDEMTVRFGDIEFCSEPIEYHPADISPLDFSLPLPDGREFSVWWSRTEAERAGSISEGIFFYLDNERSKSIWLYSMKYGDIILPIDKFTYEHLCTYNYSPFDEDTLIRIEYTKRSHLITDYRGVRE